MIRAGAEADYELYNNERVTQLVRTGLVLTLVFSAGTLGFYAIGWPEASVVDAIYMTMITLTTVGYGETIAVAGSPAAQMFVTLLLALGVGTFAYLISNLTAFMAEGGLVELLRRRAMYKRIGNLQDHYIVCGLGETGHHVVRDLLATRRPFVGIETDSERARVLRDDLNADFPVLVGDATEDRTLRAARIDRAHGIIACISNDKDNLILVVTARLLKPGLRIVSRCIDASVEPKIRAAGADAVVLPSAIGGHRLVSEMVRPVAASYLDRLMLGDEGSLRVEEMPVSPTSALSGGRLGDLRERIGRDPLILAVRGHGGNWVHHPDDTVPLSPGMSVIFLGTPEARERLAKTLAP